MESINKTDHIVKIINEITARIRILGIKHLSRRPTGEMMAAFSGGIGNRQSHHIKQKCHI